MNNFYNSILFIKDTLKNDIDDFNNFNTKINEIIMQLVIKDFQEYKQQQGE
jgi:hypothetical protein